MTDLSPADRRALSKKLVAALPPLRSMGAEDAVAAAEALKRALDVKGPVSRDAVATLKADFDAEMAKVFRGAAAKVEPGEEPSWAGGQRRATGDSDVDGRPDDDEPE